MIGYIEQLGACFSESDDEVKGKERPDVQTEAERAFVGAGAPATTNSTIVKSNFKKQKN